MRRGIAGPGRRLWAVFEPRSNTMRSRVFETDLASSLSTADLAVLGAVNRANLLGDEERLSPDASSAIHSHPPGEKREGFESADEIAEFLGAETLAGRLGPGDVQRQLRWALRQTARKACRNAVHRQGSRRMIRPRRNSLQRSCCLRRVSCAARARDDRLHRFGRASREAPLRSDDARSQRAQSAHAPNARLERLYQIRDFSSHMMQVSARDDENHALPIVKLDKQTWQVTASGTVTVTLSDLLG